jgi:hypothetical protein
VTIEVSGADRDELSRLAGRYASAVDRRDTQRYVSVFHADGALVMRDPADPDREIGRRVGHAQLAEVIGVIAAKFHRTFHLLGNAVYDIDGDTATGEVYCLAHHLLIEGERATTDARYIRYQDWYERRGGTWRIAERHHLLDWMEVREAIPW